MLRIICYEADAVRSQCAGGAVTETHKTFMVNCAEVETWLKAKKGEDYIDRFVIGVEVVPKGGE